MRRERFNLEEQVGGLIDDGHRRHRRRSAPPVDVPEPAQPQRYPLTQRATLAIRAARASTESARHTDAA